MSDQHGHALKAPSQVRRLLVQAGLRPTRQRLALGQLLFGGPHRHVTAERLQIEAAAEDIPVSLATIYNTLHQFTEAGLLRPVPVDGSKTYFDTNTGPHHHFYSERDGTIIDVPHDQMEVIGVPDAPEGMEITRIEVVVRLREKSSRR
ncbi:MAG: Fur family transcriptional regulator [Hyphomicrobiaceae bacterium]